MGPLNLIEAVTTGPAGLCGAHDPAVSAEAISDPEIRLSALTLGAILDVFPLQERWRDLASLADHWLLKPSEVAYQASAGVASALQEKGILGPGHNVRVWWQICRGVQGRFQGRFRDLLSASGDDAFKIQAYLKESKTTFPVLAGPVISARWLDMIHRIGGVPLSHWEDLSMPLSATQEEAAKAFGVSTKAAHPMTARAFSVWSHACASLGPPQCDLISCPRLSSLRRP